MLKEIYFKEKREMDKIAVIIPCYNEERTIAKVVSDARAALPEAVVYVYDNNSTDGTAETARKAGAIIRHEYVQGKGNVIRRMFREIDANCYIMVDGDDTYPMEVAPQMVDKILNYNADMVVGDRLSSTYFSENKRPFHSIGNTIVKGSINRLFDCHIKDIMTGFRAFSYGFVKTFPVLSKGFEIETEMTIHAVFNHMQIDNIVVDYRDRSEGSLSKLNTYSDGFRVLGTIFKLYRDFKPFGFFSFLALLLALISLLLFIPVLLEYFRTGLVFKFPTLIVSGFAMLAAIQSFFAGLILSNMAQRSRRDFEYCFTCVYEEEHKNK